MRPIQELRKVKDVLDHYGVPKEGTGGCDAASRVEWLAANLNAAGMELKRLRKMKNTKNESVRILQ